MAPPEAAGLASLNAMPPAAVEQVLFGCCSAARFAVSVAAGRPYDSADELYEAAADAIAALSEHDLDEALAGHPRLGERLDSSSTAGRPGSVVSGGSADAAAQAASRREQATLAQADTGTLRALAEGNRTYEQRFGHVYLVCASGRGADELLEVLRTRLGNDPATERQVTRTELGKIARLRLARLLAEDSGSVPGRAQGAQ